MRLLSLIIICLSSNVFAFDFQKLTVKVGSGLCDYDESLFQGSGVIFRHLDSDWVLTSEHVVLHGNGEYCHKVKSDSVGEVRATLALADWGYGLALLKLEDNLDIDLPGIEMFDGQHEQGEKIVTFGYPRQEQEIYSDYGKILKLTSKRGLIPLLDKVIEIKDAHGEYGMSGGVVATAEQGEFVGTLSHQYVEAKGGRSSKASDFEMRNPVSSDHLIVIPASEISLWLGSLFQDIENAKPQMSRVVSSQIQGQTQIAVRGFTFSASNVSGAQCGGANGVGGNDGVGVGGNDGVGVGGNDGVGIGGNDGVGIGGAGISMGDGLVLSVELNIDGHQLWSPQQVRPQWGDRIKRALLRQQELNILYFFSFNEDRTRLDVVNYCSLAEFFTMLAKDDYEPATAIVGDVLNDSDSRLGKLSEVRDHSAIIRKELQVVQSSIDSASPSANLIRGKALVRQLTLLADLLETENWYMVNRGWIDHLIENNSGWNFLFTDSNFDSATSMLTSLYSIRAAMKSLNL